MRRRHLNHTTFFVFHKRVILKKRKTNARILYRHECKTGRYPNVYPDQRVIYQYKEGEQLPHFPTASVLWTLFIRAIDVGWMVGLRKLQGTPNAFPKVDLLSISIKLN